MKATLRSALLITLCFGLAGYTQADEPPRPECIAPASPGGGFDLTCKLAQSALLQGEYLSRPMRVTYMPGGIGAVAYNHVNGVRTDDPGLIVAASTGAAVNLALGKFGEYDADEVRWLGALGVDYGAIVVSADAPWQNLGDLMADLKENPNEIAFGAGGTVTRDAVGQEDALALRDGAAPGRQPFAIRLDVDVPHCDASRGSVRAEAKMVRGVARERSQYR